MKKQVLILIGAIILIAGFFYFTNTSNSQQGAIFETNHDVSVQDEHLNEGDELTINVEKETGSSGMIFVDVQGEVNQPGVFGVTPDVRVGYLIELAGGLTDDAVVRGLNQAARVYDEMVIFVPHVDEFVVHEDTEIGGSNLISLSNASAIELQTLPGIGPALSANIIEHRNAFGAFLTIDELINVPGVGQGIMENIREFIKP